MCVIIYAPGGEIPEDHLAAGLLNNPDGWGLMWFDAKKKEIIIRKGMQTKLFWDAWDSRPDNAAVIFHARWATHGTRNISNCHPFRFKKHHLAMAHNGVIDMPRHRKLNDTQMFMRDILEPMPTGFLNNKHTRAFLGDIIDKSKLVFLDGKGKVRIINQHLGHWKNGRWHSNYGYLPRVCCGE